MHSKFKNQNGFTLPELVIGVTVFVVLIISVYNAYKSIFDIVYTSRAKLEAVDLANEELEIVRNLPFSDVGIAGSIPVGKLAHTQTILRGSSTFSVTTTVRNIDDPFDGTIGGTPNDTSPADYKLVEIEIDCALCRKFIPITVTTKVAPKNLETASTNGALFVRVFDASGNPIADADVHIENNIANPHIVIDDVTNAAGLLQVVDAPPGVNAYDITVTKSGYSTDRTYAATGGNPTPAKPPATVAIQTVTQLSFVIDRISTFTVSSVNITCSAIPSFDFELKGAKTIGVGVLKYDQNKITNGSGLLSISGLEWDSYSFIPIDSTLDLVGMNPISPVNLNPNSTQSVQLVVATKNPRTILVTVKDGATLLPLSDVDVGISKTGFTSATSTTGQGFINQTDWSGGGGQATSTDPAQYFSSDGNVSINTPTGAVVLRKILGDYVPSATLDSSSFDTGSPSNFQKIQWLPISQPLGAGTPNVRMQIATNNDGGTWDYTGPDGTGATYYTTANQNVNSASNGSRYLRYRLFLDSVSTTTTPNISDISFTFTSACTPPGQVVFDGLASGTYNLHFTKPGYFDQDVPVNADVAWQQIEVVLLPN